MSNKDFRQILNAMMAEIGTLPTQERKKVEALAGRCLELLTDTRQHGDPDTGILESIDFIRLAIKYMLFDIEATKRENQYLRELLEADTG